MSQQHRADMLVSRALYSICSIGADEIKSTWHQHYRDWFRRI